MKPPLLQVTLEWRDHLIYQQNTECTQLINPPVESLDKNWLLSGFVFFFKLKHFVCWFCQRCCLVWLPRYCIFSRRAMSRLCAPIPPAFCFIALSRVFSSVIIFMWEWYEKSLSYWTLKNCTGIAESKLLHAKNSYRRCLRGYH